MLSKRLFDIAVSLIGMLLLYIPGLVVAALIKLTSRGPVLFAQQRIGKGGRLFTCIKFCTMREGAQLQGSVTIASDGRITFLGGLLRKLKLDEIPQLWNVPVGNTSFVGPRPDVAGCADKLASDRGGLLILFAQ
jgi:lipopolysaccharide/colanic/teichoic acid biosynthesis glycosyltransferase